MIYPQVKFKVEAERDYDNYRRFVRYAEPRFVKLFVPQDLAKRLAAAGGDWERLSLVRRQVEEAFRVDAVRIRRNAAATERAWRGKERSYFSLMEKVFCRHDWPKGKYVGYASVFRMYPRDVRDKTFYFSAYDFRQATATAAHEMTHFMFFDYVRRHYGLKEGGLVPGRGPNYLWNVSEVFNATLEGWGPYQKIFRTSGETYDAVNRRMLPRMRRIWESDPDIERLLRRYLGKPKRSA